MDKLSGMSKASKPIIGIVGGICSGKSAAAQELGRIGCAVIDADEIAHRFLDDENIRSQIVGVFGKGVLDEQGKISRSGLARRVFGDPSSLRVLTGILHPPVLAEVERLTSDYKERPGVRGIVFDMPLLMEVGWEKRCDYVIFIDCAPSRRLERAQKTGIFGADELKIRENLQISLDKKRCIADNVADNNSDLMSLSRQIASIFSSIVDGR